jgi:hypothetical protein
VDSDDLPYELVNRHVARQVHEHINDFRITIVNGPRQAGKTTLLRQVHQDVGGAFVTLDDEDQRSAARTDPRGYLQGLPRPLFVDEVQRAGDSFVLAVKAEVDRHPHPGSFILSGSTRFLTVPTLSESLAGRAALVDLWPFSVAERIGASPDFLDRLFAEPAALVQAQTEPITRHEYLRLACTGGFPEAVRRQTARSRGAWFRSYLTTVTQREVADIARIRHLELLPRLVRLLAALTAEELNAARLAQDLGIDADTVRSYLPLLETVYLIHLLPAWSRNLATRVKRRPKIHLIDTGLAAWLREQSADSLARPGNTAGAGALFETFVVNELMKLRAASEVDVSLWHLQDRAGGEVDCVIETSSGRVVAIEVKTAATARAEDFRHLRKLRDRLGTDFLAGVVLFAGADPVPFGDRLFALPVSLLWGGVRPSL